MIISHEHKYVFIKPGKVAGTSVEINLAKHCGPEDVVAPIDAYERGKDGNPYAYEARNYREFGEHPAHMKPAEIRKIMGEKAWNEYFKFTIVRNPWDVIVSRYWWEKERGSLEPLGNLKRHTIMEHLLTPKAYAFVARQLFIRLKAALSGRRRTGFGFLVRNLDAGSYTNDDYYFDSGGNPVCDFYMRFESLDRDYEKACGILGIPYEELPRTKDKVRRDRRHYSEYYDEALKDVVGKKCRRQIDFFGYAFEGK